MKKKVYKIFFDFEKEEKWLNEMAAKGLNLVNLKFGRYLFEQGLPGQYIYRFELLGNKSSHPESKKYIEFMNEAGVECVCMYMDWVVFRKKASEGEFDIYSDYDSRIKHYSRIVKSTCAGMGLCFIGGIGNAMICDLNGSLDFSAVVSAFAFVIVVICIPMLISYIRTIKRLKREKSIKE